MFFALVLATAGAALAAMARLLGANDLSVVDILMLAVFAVTLPWTVIGFWNALVGFVILRSCRDPVRHVAPLAGLGEEPRRPRGQTAIVCPVYNEDPELVARHLRATVGDLARSGGLDGFEVFWLSDTQDTGLIAAEARIVTRLRADPLFAGRLRYRRRLDNAGYKTGNLWDFVETHGQRFAHMLVLDADSLMSGAAIRRLVHLMEANPRLGILQTLITGLPTRSAFARLFQFGMRHGMRSYTTGSAWWQGPAGPYWGHNAIINLRAFEAHGRLPTLAGRAPWGGLVLSHDMVEAVSLQRAGYEVRVLPDEFGSHEINPPCLNEFVRRSLRWCQGNLQYVQLVGRRGWHPMGRLQLALAILMYLSGAAWLTFTTLGFIQGVFGLDGGVVLGTPWQTAPVWLGLGLLATMLTMTFAPKLAGLADALLDQERRRSYGGGAALLAAGLAELVFGVLLAPIMALSEAFFILRMLTGRGLAWTTQVREGQGVAWRDAVRRFWPQTLAGAAMFLAFWLFAPGLIGWIVPMAAGPLIAIAFARYTAAPAVGRVLAAWRVAAVPEEHATSPVVAAALPWLRARPRRPSPESARLAPATAPALPSGGD